MRSWKIYLSIFFVLGGVALIYGLYYWFLYTGFSVQVDQAGALVGIRSGTFGDAFGVLNALFSGLAFSGVLITLLLQRKDLSEAHDQNALQQAESQFYSMLNLQQQVIQGFDLHVSRGDTPYTIQGRDCFRDWHRKLIRAFKHTHDSDDRLRVVRAYQIILSAHQGDLGLYFRSLYSVFKFIERDKYIDKAHFSRVVRSLISDFELVFLYYNCLSPRGESFQRFATMYELFDNIDVDLLLDKKHVLYMHVESFGSNEEALKLVRQANSEGA